MLTGLLYNKPDDHLQFLGDCINSAKKIPSLKWDSFLDHSKKPLPAIPRVSDGPIRSESFGLSDEPAFPTFKTEPVLEMKLQTKLPAIRKDNKDDVPVNSNNNSYHGSINEYSVKEESGLTLFTNQTVIFVLGELIVLVNHILLARTIPFQSVFILSRWVGYVVCYQR